MTINSWQLRLTGIGMIVMGGFLLVWALRNIQTDWPQIFAGLISVFAVAIGFGLLIMPFIKHQNPTSLN